MEVPAATRRHDLGIVADMIGGEEPGDDDDPGPDDAGPWGPPPDDGPRQWRHPSEVGLVARGNRDRRRSSLIAVGVLVGGLGLLTTGLVMGRPAAETAASSTTSPDRVEASVTAVMAVEADGSSAAATAVVVDGNHLMVDADAVDGADTFWAHCQDGSVEPARIVGVDDATGLAVLHVAQRAGVPVRSLDAPPGPRSSVVLVRAEPTATTLPARVGESGGAQFAGLGVPPGPRHFSASPVTTDTSGAAVTATPTDPGAATPAELAGSAVFAPSGQLAGMVVEGDDSSVAVLDGRDALAAARSLIDGD